MLFSNHCKSRCLLALTLALWALPGHAQQRVTADEAVALALSQPHVRQELAAAVDSARSEVLEARTWANPQLELSQERGGRAPGGDSRETEVVLSQEFELGGRRGLRTDAAELGVRAARVAGEYELAQLRAEVLRGYSHAVAAERMRQAQARAASGLQALGAVADKRQRAGDLSGYESRRIVQAASLAQASAAQAEAAAHAARARLAGWIGDVALSARLDSAPPLPALPVLTEDGLSPELQALQARREYAAAQARAERRTAVPLSVGVGTKRVEDAGISDSLMILQLGVPLPVFDRNQAARARAAAVAQRADAQYQRVLLQTQARRAAAIAQAQLLSASARTLFDSAVPEAARLTEIARASFAEGELDLVGLLDAHEAETGVLEQALEQQSRALDALLELQLLIPSSTPSIDPIP